MDNVINLNEHRPPVVRLVEMPDGSMWDVSMPSHGWDAFDFVLVVEDITPGEIGVYALEEMELQELTFDEAFHTVVAYLAGRWFDEGDREATND